MVTHHYFPQHQRTSVVWGPRSNPGGTASEFFRIDAHLDLRTDAPEQYLFRAGVATIDRRETEFTRFPGLQRTHLLLSGESTVTIDGVPHLLTGAYPQLAFSGEASAACSIANPPVNALNLMFTSDVSVNMQAVLTEAALADAAAVTAPGVMLELFYLLSGEARGELESGAVELAPHDAFASMYRFGRERTRRIRFSPNAEFVYACVTMPQGT